MRNSLLFSLLRRLLAAAFALSALINCKSAHYSTVRNLDFEYRLNRETPTRWGIPDKLFQGYAASLDFQQRLHGKASLRLEQTDPEGFGWAGFSQTLPVSSVAGREVALSGWIRTEGVTDGFADLYIGDGELNYHTLVLDTAGRGVRNTAEWTRITLKKRIGENSSGVTIGGILKGPGTAWFDNMELLIDGKPLRDTLFPAPKTRLTRADKRELRKYIYPLRTCEPDESKAEEGVAGGKAGESKAGDSKAGDSKAGGGMAGESMAGGGMAGEGNTDDLRVLETLIGKNSVVALGENSHGSSEIYRMKHRMIRYLAQEMGFDIFSIEANMPESYLLNEYTVEGKGDPKTRIAGMYFWTWKTQEMLDLVEWMRDFNRGGRKITYTGFDMQFYEESVSILDAAFQHDAEAVKLLREIDTLLKKARIYLPDYIPCIDPEIAEKIERDLSQIESRIDCLSIGKAQMAWLRQNTALLRQYIGQGPLLLWRDRCMAENLLWIKRQNPSSRIVIWAHNGHIEKETGRMGAILQDSLGTDYVNFGFTFYDGKYTAVCPGSNEWSQTAQRAYPGTLEYLLGKLGEPMFILDLKRMREEKSPVLEWIDDMPFRHVGAVKMENEFWDRSVSKQFDYLVFIRRTTPSHLLTDL